MAKRTKHAMRSGMTQAVLHGMRKLTDEERRAVIATVGEDELELVRSALALSWCPMSRHMLICDAVRDVIGSASFVNLYRDVLLEMFERPLLRGFIQMSATLFGSDPTSALFSQSTNVSRYLAFGVGTVSCERNAEPGRAVMTLHGFPADRYNFDCYVDGFTGCGYGILRATKRTGTIEAIEKDAATGVLRNEIRWLVE